MSSQCNPALSFFAHLLLLRGQFAPLVAQHPGDLWEGHIRTLGPELLPPVIHETNVASEGGFGCIAVFHWLLPLPPFSPAATSGFLRKKRAKQKHFEGSVGDDIREQGVRKMSGSYLISISLVVVFSCGSWGASLLIHDFYNLKEDLEEEGWIMRR